jgi:hypothetical protein
MFLKNLPSRFIARQPSSWPRSYALAQHDLVAVDIKDLWKPSSALHLTHKKKRFEKS